MEGGDVLAHEAQAHAYSGFRGLYKRRPDGSRQFVEAACRAHLRRDFHDVWTPPSPRSPARRSTGSAHSTTSSARAPVGPRRISVILHRMWIDDTDFQSDIPVPYAA